MLHFKYFIPNEKSYILSATTNETGIAITRFRLPPAECPEDLGIWRVLATVNIAEVAANDTLEFHVCWNPADVDHDLDVDLYDATLILVTMEKSTHNKTLLASMETRCSGIIIKYFFCGLWLLVALLS